MVCIFYLSGYSKNSPLCIKRVRGGGGKRHVHHKLQSAIWVIFRGIIIIYICMCKHGFHWTIFIVRAIQFMMRYLDDPLKTIGYCSINVIALTLKIVPPYKLFLHIQNMFMMIIPLKNTQITDGSMVSACIFSSGPGVWLLIVRIFLPQVLTVLKNIQTNQNAI